MHNAFSIPSSTGAGGRAGVDAWGGMDGGVGGDLGLAPEEYCVT